MPGKLDAKGRREALKLSQEDIADAAGVSQGLVSKLETGKPIKPESESKIIEALAKAEADFHRISSANREQASGLPATQAPEMHHLSLVPPVAAAPRAVLPPVDRALSLAFDGKKHVVADLYAVHPIAARLPLDGRAEADMAAVFGEYLDAAALLRERGVTPTIEALLAELTFARRR